MNHSKLTIVLPCAGEGTRMGVAGPKELAEVAPSTVLIDLTLAHVKAAGNALGPEMDVVVVIDAGKEAVYDYVCSRLPEIAVARVYFDHRFREWPGSVHSAAPACGERALVLMPDSLMLLSSEDPFRDGAGHTVAETAVAALTEHSVVFGTVPCPDLSRMSRLGALKVIAGEVTAFEDKPETHRSRFNAVWGCFAFRREVEEELFRFLDGCVARDFPDLTTQPFHPAAAFPLALYADLGTPEALIQNRRELNGFLASLGTDYKSINLLQR